MNEKSKNPKSLKPKISLKWALILMFVIALPLAWLGSDIKQARFEAQLLEKLGELGEYRPEYRVWYDYQDDKSYNFYGETPEPPGPKWLRDLFGQFLFARIEGLELDGDFYSPDNIKALNLERLNGLEQLNLEFISRLEDLTPIAKVRRLKSLQILGCDNLESLKGIEGLDNLRELEIESLNFKINDVAPLKNLRRLETVRIEVDGSFPSVTNWQTLSKNQALKKLTIHGQWQSRGFYAKHVNSDSNDGLPIPATNKVSDSANVSAEVRGKFEPGPNLEFLSLWEVDSGLEDLQCCQKMPGLTTLMIKGATTLKSLDGIQFCKQLKRLEVVQCVNLASLEGIQQLENLEHLVIENSEQKIEFPTLNAAGLKTLSLRRMNGIKNLEFLRNLQLLSELDLSYSDIKTLKGLENFDKLQKLVVRWSQLEGVDCGELMAPITELDFTNCDRLVDLNGLEHFEEVNTVKLNGCRQLESIAAVGEFKSLRCLDLTGCKLLKNLDELTQVKGLNRIYVDGCISLSDVSALLDVTNLNVFDWNDCPQLEEEQVDKLVSKFRFLKVWPDVATEH